MYYVITKNYKILAICENFEQAKTVRDCILKTKKYKILRICEA